MTRFELLFVSAAFVIGVGQVVDAAALIRERGSLRGLSIGFAFLEFLWAAVCLYLLFADHLESSRWLAILFVAYIPISVVVAVAANPRFLDLQPDSIRAPAASTYFGAVFGALYALGALMLLLRG